MQRTELSQGGPADAIDRAVRTLMGVRFFGDVPGDVLGRLVGHGTLVRLAAGELLIKEGDLQAAEIFVLLDGALTVQSKSVLIDRLDRPGDVVGELAVLLAPPRSADVIAETPAELLALRPELFARAEFAGANAAFYRMLSHSLATKLKVTATHSREQLDRATREAATDALTGLANRKRLDAFLAGLLHEPARLPFSLVMVDVDNFKQYNDANGHQMGDAVLAKVGMILQAGVRQGDLAVRYGGEEFAVVLPACESAHALRIAEKLRATIARESFSHGGRPQPGQVTATFGVATCASGERAEDVLRRADQALYRGKAAGRNRVESGERAGTAAP